MSAYSRTRGFGKVGQCAEGHLSRDKKSKIKVSNRTLGGAKGQESLLKAVFAFFFSPASPRPHARPYERPGVRIVLCIGAHSGAPYFKRPEAPLGSSAIHTDMFGEEGWRGRRCWRWAVASFPSFPSQNSHPHRSYPQSTKGRMDPLHK